MRVLPRLAALLAFLALDVAPAQGVLGKFTTRNPQGAVLTLLLQQDGPGKVTGSFSGNGVTFLVEGQQQGEDVTGTMRNNSGGVYFEASPDGENLRVILIEPGADGKPDYTRGRELSFTRDGSPAAAAPAATAQGAASTATGAGTALATTPQDQQIARLLLSSAWCSFSYSGGSTYNGGSYGTSSTSRAQFSTDGTMRQTGGSENTNSGAAGSVYGNSAGGSLMFWRVQNGQLMLSQDRAQWQPITLQITQNSNGYPIITANGTEYMQCQ
jgi:hypothetical protein